MQKKNKAALALGVSVLGSVATMPAAAGSFSFGMLHHGFLAATIGGFADWFAVTALFRKPLGISYRTDILRKNRARIMDALVDFAAKDLLSVDNIMQVVHKQDFAEMLLSYFRERDGDDRLKSALDALLLRAVNTADFGKVAAVLAPLVQEGMQTFVLRRVVEDMGKLLLEERYSKQIFATLTEIFESSLGREEIQSLLLTQVSAIREAYVKDSAGREFVFSALGLSDEKLLAMLIEEIHKKLKEFATEEDQQEARTVGVEIFLQKIREEVDAGAGVAWEKVFFQQANIALLLQRWMEEKLTGNNPFWLPYFHAFIDEKITMFSERKDWQEQYDAFAKAFFEKELTEHQGLITRFVRDRMEKLSDDELITLIESKVQDDLQMIRINGSLVGATVGMALYLVVTIAERM